MNTPLGAMTSHTGCEDSFLSLLLCLRLSSLEKTLTFHRVNLLVLILLPSCCVLYATR